MVDVGLYWLTWQRSFGAEELLASGLMLTQMVKCSALHTVCLSVIHEYTPAALRLVKGVTVVIRDQPAQLIHAGLRAVPAAVFINDRRVAGNQFILLFMYSRCLKTHVLRNRGAEPMRTLISSRVIGLTPTVHQTVLLLLSPHHFHVATERVASFVCWLRSESPGKSSLQLIDECVAAENSNQRLGG